MKITFDKFKSLRSDDQEASVRLEDGSEFAFIERDLTWKDVGRLEARYASQTIGYKVTLLCPHDGAAEQAWLALVAASTGASVNADGEAHFAELKAAKDFCRAVAELLTPGERAWFQEREARRHALRGGIKR